MRAERLPVYSAQMMNRATWREGYFAVGLPLNVCRLL
jgi:hypothetical protein